jgi:hypothetical protein
MGNYYLYHDFIYKAGRLVEEQDEKTRVRKKETCLKMNQIIYDKIPLGVPVWELRILIVIYIGFLVENIYLQIK